MKTRMFLLLCLAFGLAAVCISTAYAEDTPVIGFIEQDTRWTRAESPYVTLGNVLVKEGATLTIEPGVTIKFDSGHKLTIDGMLIARGAAEDSITFTPKEDRKPGAWGGILFENTAASAQFDENGNYIGGSILQYCVVEFAGIIGNSVSPFVDNCRISNNDGSGIAISESDFVVISDNKINGNVRQPGRWGGYTYSGLGIYISGSSTVIINNNFITQNSGESWGGFYYGDNARGIGIYVSGDNITLNGNTVTQNTATGEHVNGGGICIDSKSNAGTITLRDNTVSENVIHGGTRPWGSASGAGVAISGNGNIILRHNTVTRNKATSRGSYSGGISISTSGNVTLSHNTINGNEGNGAFIRSTHAIINNNNFSENRGYGVDIGGKSITTVNNNNFERNTGNAIQCTGDTTIISNNSFTENSGWAISTGGDTGIISSNYFTENTNGAIQVDKGMITVINNEIIGNSGSYIVKYGGNGKITGNFIAQNQGTYAVYITQADVKFNRNAVFDNQTDYNLYYGQRKGSPNLDATNNYWGVTSEVEIRGKIYDFFQNSNLALVNVVPFLTEPPPIEEPYIQILTSSHNFGVVSVGSHTDWNLVVFNLGDVVLTVSNIASDNPAFTIPSPTFPQEFSPGDNVNITVRFSPTEEKPCSGTLTIASNDAVEPSLSVFVRGTSAPEVAWTRTFSSYSCSGFWKDCCCSAHSVQQTLDGGYILVGSTWPLWGLVRPGDVWLIKTNSEGRSLWKRTFGGTGLEDYEHGYSVQQTWDGGYILAGENGDYAWLIKTDAEGRTLWDRSFYGGCAYSVQQTSDGGYILAGEEDMRGTDKDVWLIKTDSEGEGTWGRTFGGSEDDYAYSVQQTLDGGYILAGYTRSFGAGGSDVWLIKTDSEGQKLWERTFGGAKYDYARSVQQTSDGGYILAGQTDGDAWLIKTDAEGGKLWDHTFYGGCAYSVQQTSDGGYILAGQSAWLIKTDSEGQKLWERTLRESARSVQQTSDGGYILAGSIGYGSYPTQWSALLIKVEGKLLTGPAISLSAKGHILGEVPVESYADWTLTISSIGDAALTVNSITSSNPAFTILSPNFPQNIPPAGSINVTVRFSPTEEKSYTGTLAIASNDSDEPSLSVSLTGEGKVGKPDLKIHLILFPETPTAMEPATVELKIKNDGDAKSSSGNLKVGLCVLRENLQPFQGDVIDQGKVEAIEPGEVKTHSFEYTFISNGYSKYLEVTLIAEPGMDANVLNNTKRIDFIPLPNKEAYWNCVGEIATIFSFGLLEGNEDIEFAKEVMFYAWDRGREAYGLSDALGEGDVKKVITIFGKTAWDTSEEIFKLSGRKLVGKVMSYIKLAYSTLEAAKNESQFLGCVEVWPRAWETLKELLKTVWERIKATGENIFICGFIVDSPVDLIVEDSSGNTTSVVQGVITEGIENSFGIEFESHKAVTIIGNEVYTVKIKGTGAGECEATVFKPDPEGNLVRITYKNLPTTDHSVATLVVGQDMADYPLSLDNDGDGTVDETRTPDIVEGITPPTGGVLKSENIYTYPNPFNPGKGSATLRFSLSEPGKVTVKLYDVAGQLVATVAKDRTMEAKVEQSLLWNGKNNKGDLVASGIYFCVISTDQGERAVCKVAVLR